MLLTLAFPVSVLASENSYSNSDLNDMEQGEFEEIIEEILDIKAAYPEYTDEMILKIMIHHTWRNGEACLDREGIRGWPIALDKNKKHRYPIDSRKMMEKT